MSQKFDRLVTLLKELFQLDQPDLDFGLYRIMHAKSGEVTQFLERDLLPQVREAFAHYQTADRASLEKELAKAIEQAEELGVDPESTQKVKELRTRLASEAVDLDALESEVYDHLYSFFRRYYSEGDFLSKRVYKPGVYAIPYEGEEVKLHWANADQYYIKTSEYLRDYAFRLHPESPSNPMRVHFRLVDAAEGEHGNVKEAKGKERRFKLVEKDAVLIDNGELVVRFTYQPDPQKQKELNQASERAILALRSPVLAQWIKELGSAHVRADGTEAGTRLRVHLDRYTARNTFDYFIHKDLGGFLRRELDFYIKNEVMHLDDVENETVPRVEQYLSKVRVIRQIAGKIITFLAQLEDFQKKLWLKKKFVVETSWLIRVGCIPEEFYPEIAANKAQHDEWVKLLAINQINGDLTTVGYTKQLTPTFLKGNPTLMIDTRHFDDAFAIKLLDVLEGLDELVDGVMLHSENFQGLSLLQKTFRQRIHCTYIDPPYNAKTSEILYKNSFRDSSWLALMENRLSILRQLETNQAVLVVAIDEVEQENLGHLLREEFPSRDHTCVVIVHNATGQQGNNFSSTHEYAYFVFPTDGQSIGLQDRSEDPDVRPLRNVSKGSHLREHSATCFYPILVSNGRIVGFGEVCPEDFHPSGMNVLRPDGIVEVYPVDSKGIERKWVFGRETVENIREELSAQIDPATKLWDIVRTKTRFNYKTVWTAARYSANSWGSRVLNDIMGESTFSFPKSVFTVRDCIDAALNNRTAGRILDFFAGSGTTGHSVIMLNREDGGMRRFILIEMGEYFDTVLLPRLKKITFSPDWKNGKPKRKPSTEEVSRSPRIMKVIRLESYEDALNNLEIRRPDMQSALFDVSAADSSERFREEYRLQYMLNVETVASQSLLNIKAFTDPTAYKLKVKRPGSDESREVNVDLVETFNWLIGLTVHRIAAPKAFEAAFKRDGEQRLVLDGPLVAKTDGPFWFRTVTGTNPEGRNVLVIWRKLTGDHEKDNLVLNKWFSELKGVGTFRDLHIVYVNGSHNLELTRTTAERWAARLIEDDFHRLMFDTEDV